MTLAFALLAANVISLRCVVDPPRNVAMSETACLFRYTLSVQKDSTAHILIQPSALGSEGEWSEPIRAYMKGLCTPKKVGA